MPEAGGEATEVVDVSSAVYVQQSRVVHDTRARASHITGADRLYFFESDKKRV